MNEDEDYLYHEFCTSYPVEMSRRDDGEGLRDAITLNLPVPVWLTNNTNNTEGRRERLRARIARCTRAIFRTTQTPLPTKKIQKDFKAGVDAFLVYAFGDMFAPGSQWYENPHPYEFFYSLIAIATKGNLILTEKQFEALFYKSNNQKSAIWKMNEKTCDALQLNPNDIMREMTEIKKNRVNEFATDIFRKVFKCL